VPGLQGADYSGGRIEAVDLATGEFEVVYRETEHGPLRSSRSRSRRTKTRAAG
jgi:hypothetical protein